MRTRLSLIVLALLTLSLIASASNPSSVTQLGQLSGTDNQSIDLFGVSVAVANHTTAVGAVNADGTAGEIYIYEEPASGWGTMNQTARLTPTSQCDLGQAIAISADGSTVVSFAGFCSGGGFLGYGWLEVFVRPASGWQDTNQPTAVLTLNNPASTNDLGLHLAISADGKFIAATGATQGTSFVSVFTRPNGGWTTSNLSSTFVAGTGYINQIAIGGQTVAVNDTKAGTVLVYQRNGGAFKQVATLSTSDGGFLYSYWSGLAIDGGTIVAGAAFNSNGNPPSGAAYVYVEPAGGWKNATETAKLTASSAPSGANFGSAVSISGNNVVVGGLNASAAYLYTKPASGWKTTSQPNATLTVSDPNQVNFGASVAIYGSTIVVGDPFEGADFNQNGAAWVFQVN